MIRVKLLLIISSLLTVPKAFSQFETLRDDVSQIAYHSRAIVIDSKAVVEKDKSFSGLGRCVNANAYTVHQSMTDYLNFVNVDKSNKDRLPYVRERAVELEKVLEKKVREDSSGTDYKVFLKLKPFKVVNEDNYAKLPLRCISVKYSNDRYEHKCSVYVTPKIKTNGHINAIERFASNIEVFGNSNNCPNNQTEVRFKVVLVTDQAEMNALKEEAIENYLKSTGVLGRVLSRGVSESSVKSFEKIFGSESDFFKNYYTGFYNAWLESLN